MRLPKLVSQLFHRRSKSDTALTVVHAKSPHIALLSTSTSWPYLNERLITSEPPSLSGILASISTEPVALDTTLPLPSIALPSVPSAEISIIGSGWSVPWLTRSSSLGAGCSTGDCQTGLDPAETLSPEIAALESALQMERNLHDETITENKQLASHITELQADILKLRGELFNALKKSADTPSLPNNDILKTLKGENTRLRMFVSLMVSASAHKSILEIAFKRTLDGEDPEEAVIHALREDTGNIGSILRTLLEPMTGPKSPQDYLAQVDCTLKARRETRDWRKKARFWKNSARQGGRHLNTVTPSVSALSDVVEQLPSHRQEAVDKILGKLRKGTLSLVAEKHSTVGPTFPRHSLVPPTLEENTSHVRSSRPTSGVVSIPTPLSPLAESTGEFEIVPQVIEPSAEVADSSYKECVSGLSQSGSDCSLRSHRGSLRHSFSNLAPLASVTFRENYSIKSKRSFNSRRNSTASVRGLTPSGSTSSQDSEASRRSARRKVKILAISISDESLEDTQRCDVSQMNDSSLCPAAFEENKDDCTTSGSSSRVTSQASSVVPVSLFSPKRQSSSSSSISTSPPETPIKAFVSPRITLSPPMGTPTKSLRSPSAMSLTPKAYYSPSPKKSPSKLPVLRMTSIPRPSLRRLSLSSISKPVLRDTTNAGAVPSNGGSMPKRKIQSPPVPSAGKKAVLERNVASARAGKGKLALSPKSKKSVEVGAKESRIGKYGAIAAR